MIRISLSKTKVRFCGESGLKRSLRTVAYEPFSDSIISCPIILMSPLRTTGTYSQEERSPDLRSAYVQKAFSFAVGQKMAVSL
jgi:hypothetical protein